MYDPQTILKGRILGTLSLRAIKRRFQRFSYRNGFADPDAEIADCTAVATLAYAARVPALAEQPPNYPDTYEGYHIGVLRRALVQPAWEIPRNGRWRFTPPTVDAHA